MKARLPKGREDVELPDRHKTRAEIPEVIQVGTLRHVGKALLFGDLLHLGEEALLAEVAPVHRGVPVAGHVQLIGGKDELPDAIGFAERLRLLCLPPGERGGGGGQGKALVPEHLVRCIEKERGVHAPGEGDGNTSRFLQEGAELLPLAAGKVLVHLLHGGFCRPVLICHKFRYTPVENQKKAPVGVTTMSVVMSVGRQGMFSCTCSL